MKISMKQTNPALAARGHFDIATRSAHGAAGAAGQPSWQ